MMWLKWWPRWEITNSVTLWFVNTYPCLGHLPLVLHIQCMRQSTGLALAQIMSCRLLGAKPLSKPMLGYCQLGPWEQIAVNFYLKISSAKWWPFCPGGDESNKQYQQNCTDVYGKSYSYFTIYMISHVYPLIGWYSTKCPMRSGKILRLFKSLHRSMFHDTNIWFDFTVLFRHFWQSIKYIQNVENTF